MRIDSVRLCQNRTELSDALTELTVTTICPRVRQCYSSRLKQVENYARFARRRSTAAHSIRRAKSAVPCRGTRLQFATASFVASEEVRDKLTRQKRHRTFIRRSESAFEVGVSIGDPTMIGLEASVRRSARSLVMAASLHPNPAILHLPAVAFQADRAGGRHFELLLPALRRCTCSGPRRRGPRRRSRSNPAADTS